MAFYRCNFIFIILYLQFCVFLLLFLQIQLITIIIVMQTDFCFLFWSWFSSSFLGSFFKIFPEDFFMSWNLKTVPNHRCCFPPFSQFFLFYLTEDCHELQDYITNRCCFFVFFCLSFFQIFLVILCSFTVQDLSRWDWTFHFFFSVWTIFFSLFFTVYALPYRMHEALNYKLFVFYTICCALFLFSFFTVYGLAHGAH